MCVRLQPRSLFLKPRSIPLKFYMLQTLLFFAMSYLNNVAFDFHISQPVHVIVRSSNLVVTCILGLCLGKRWALSTSACTLFSLLPYRAITYGFDAH